MSSIMSRKAAEFWWNLPINGVERPKFFCPSEVAYYKKDNHDQKFIPVTWKEIYAERKKKQDANIYYKIGHTEQIRPCFINVYFDDIDYKGTWLMYIILREIRVYARDLLKSKIMDMFPCGVIPFDFKTWAEAFERTHHRVYKDRRRKKNALLKCWALIDKRGDIADIFPLNQKPNYGTERI